MQTGRQIGINYSLLTKIKFFVTKIILQIAGYSYIKEHVMITI